MLSFLWGPAWFLRGSRTFVIILLFSSCVPWVVPAEMGTESLKLSHGSRGKEACRNRNGRTGGEGGVESFSPLVPTSASSIKVNVKEMEGYLNQTIFFIYQVYLRLSQAFPAACYPPPLISDQGGGYLIFFVVGLSCLNTPRGKL